MLFRLMQLCVITGGATFPILYGGATLPILYGGSGTRWTITGTRRTTCTWNRSDPGVSRAPLCVVWVKYIGLVSLW